MIQGRHFEETCYRKLPFQSIPFQSDHICSVSSAMTGPYQRGWRLTWQIFVYQRSFGLSPLWRKGPLWTLAERNCLKKTTESEVRSLKHGLSTAALQAGRKITRKTYWLTDWKQHCPPLYGSRHISYKSVSSVPELASRHNHNVLWRSTEHILSCSWTRQLSQNVTVHAGFLRDKFGVLGGMRKETPCASSIFCNKAFLKDNIKPLYETLH